MFNYATWTSLNATLHGLKLKLLQPGTLLEHRLKASYQVSLSKMYSKSFWLKLRLINTPNVRQRYALGHPISSGVVHPTA